MSKCFLDTNFLVYLTDQSSSYYLHTKQMLRNFEKKNLSLLLSHEVIEEFMYVIMKFSRLAKEDVYKNLEKAVSKLALIPDLSIVSAPNDINFASKVFLTIKRFKLAPNDGYILSIILDNQIPYFATFDKKLIGAAKKLHIKIVSQQN